MASIRKRGDSYTITVSCGRDINGKQIRETTTFKPPAGLTPKKEQKAAEDFARDFEAKVKNGLVMDGRKITLKEFADRWFLEYAPQQLQAGTLEKYRQEMEKVLPTLGHLKLTDLRPAVLHSFIVGMTKDGARRDGKPGGYSKGTITKTRNVFSSIPRTAVEWEVLDRNPLDKVRIQADDAAEKLKFFTPEQTGLFLDFIEKPYTVTTKGHQRTDDTGRAYTVGDYQSKKEVPEQLRVLFNLAQPGRLLEGCFLDLHPTRRKANVLLHPIRRPAGNGPQGRGCPRTNACKRGLKTKKSRLVRQMCNIRRSGRDF